MSLRSSNFVTIAVNVVFRQTSNLIYSIVYIQICYVTNRVLSTGLFIVGNNKTRMWDWTLHTTYLVIYNRLINCAIIFSLFFNKVRQSETKKTFVPHRVDTGRPVNYLEWPHLPLGPGPTGAESHAAPIFSSARENRPASYLSKRLRGCLRSYKSFLSWRLPMWPWVRLRLNKESRLYLRNVITDSET